MRQFFITFLSYLTLISCFNFSSAYAATHLDKIQLAVGFKISMFADANTKNGEFLAGARFMALDVHGNLYVSSAKGNQVVMLPDKNHDGVADEVVVVADNLNEPQGLAFVGDDLLIANQDGVVKLQKDAANQSNGGWAKEVTPFIKDLPAGGHRLKTIKLGPDGYLYINEGSSCNVCIEVDPLRATMLRYTVDGKPAGALVTLGRHQQSAVWARGLRNAQGYTWHPKTGDMYATNAGADMRSGTKNGAVDDELPPEHLNKIEAGKHYGWPHCWGGKNGTKAQTEDPNFPAGEDFCKTTQAPEVTLTSHSTPIGITFLNKTNWPTAYQQDAIVALHGSWNRQQASGYKLVRVRFKDNKASTVEDFATGWLNDNQAWGRPVDLAVGADGAMYVTDDKSGVVYRVFHE